MELTIKPITADQVRALIAWEYAGPYAIYNMSAAEGEYEESYFLDADNGYLAIMEEQGEFLGFCNYGKEARVPGGDYSSAAIDIGMGMRPDLTGQGKGALYAAAVFEFAQREYPSLRQRVTIAEFNKRAQQLCRKFGFVQVARFEDERNGRPFIVMVRK